MASPALFPALLRMFQPYRVRIFMMGSSGSATPWLFRTQASPSQSGSKLRHSKSPRLGSHPYPIQVCVTGPPFRLCEQSRQVDYDLSCATIFTRVKIR